MVHPMKAWIILVGLGLGLVGLAAAQPWADMPMPLQTPMDRSAMPMDPSAMPMDPSAMPMDPSTMPHDPSACPGMTEGTMPMAGMMGMGA